MLLNGRVKMRKNEEKTDEVNEDVEPDIMWKKVKANEDEEEK